MIVRGDITKMAVDVVVNGRDSQRQEETKQEEVVAFKLDERKIASEGWRFLYANDF